jgi:hypothetical protein
MGKLETSRQEAEQRSEQAEALAALNAEHENAQFRLEARVGELEATLEAERRRAHELAVQLDAARARTRELRTTLEAKTAELESRRARPLIRRTLDRLRLGRA